jgi:outer membrane protein assembly factor BamB
MRIAIRAIGVTVGCVVLIGASCVLAQDWPQWRGANRDGKVTGFTAPDAWPKALAEKWKTTVGSGDATPALVGDRLYVFTRQGEDEVILCLDAGTGKEVWRDKYAVEAIVGADSRAHPGPRSSPAVGDGKVVTLGVSAVVSCVDAATGKTVWRNDEYKGVPQFHTATSPIIVDGMAIVQLGGPKSGTTVAFDLATGNQKWKWAGDGPGFSSPVLMTVDGTKQIVTLTDKSAVGLGVADGKLLWQVSFVPMRMAYNAATPIVDGQTVIITGSGRGAKALKIEKEGDGFAAKELWSNPQLAPQFNSPVLKDGLLFGLSDKGMLYCIDAKTGKTAWTDKNKLSNFGAIVDAGPVLLTLPEKSGLIAFKPDAKQYEELARITVSDTPIYATPVVSGKKVFVKGQNAVTLWSLE